MNTYRRYWKTSVFILAIAACANEPEDDSDASADELSLGNLMALMRGKIDRTVVDPYNPWAKRELQIGEENVLPGEAEEFAGYATLANRMQRSVETETKSPEPHRTFHAKAHACVRGELSVDNKALPQGARIGLFGQNKSYPTWVRFSNGMGTPQGDRKVDVRGLAVKIMGVEGERSITLPGDDTATTQDFLMADQTVAPASDARHMMQFGDAMSSSKDTSSVFGKIDGLVKKGAFLTRDENVRIVDFFVNRLLPQSKKVGSPLGDVFYSGAPNALGLEAGDPNTARAKGAFKLMATAGVLLGNTCKPANEEPNKTPGYFRAALERQLEKGDVCIDFSVQFQKDPKSEPIEDVSVEWRTPFTKFARLTFGKIDLSKEAASEATCNDFSFAPWHTLQVHRPLGNAMRARRVVLPASAKFRGATMVEPRP